MAIDFGELREVATQRHAPGRETLPRAFKALIEAAEGPGELAAGVDLAMSHIDVKRATKMAALFLRDDFVNPRSGARTLVLFHPLTCTLLRVRIEQGFRTAFNPLTVTDEVSGEPVLTGHIAFKGFVVSETTISEDEADESLGALAYNALYSLARGEDAGWVALMARC